MSYIETAKQNQINAQKARALDDIDRSMQTEQAIKSALKAREDERISALVSEFAPSRFEYEMQRAMDDLDRRYGKPLSQKDQAVAARNWVPNQNSNVQTAVQQQLQAIR